MAIPATTEALFERYSDSAGAYVVLDRANTSVYKQLYRAAKAKQKLKLRITTKKPAEQQIGPRPASVEDEVNDDAPAPAAPTDSEREADNVVAETSHSTALPEQTSTEPASEAPAPAAEELRSLKEMLEESARLDRSRVQDMPDRSTQMPASSAALPSPPNSPPIVMGPIMPAGCPALRGNYAVCCNSCDRTIPDAHYHCSTCDDGDFDLCEECVDRGVTCKGRNHWLIKRFVKNGTIINSTTERLAPKPKQKAQSAEAPAPAPAPAPPVPERIIPVFADVLYSSMRTCNCCVQELPEVNFVHCTTCDDYDLCRTCFAKNRHGHHPKHAFVAAVEGTRLEPEVARRLEAGRDQPHNAICDGCDENIKGIRHKCLDCPDWDYCSRCVVDAHFVHPGHRFVPIYEPIRYDGWRATKRPVHAGICCDGPLCATARRNHEYIVGNRYKCAVCDDVDFCESCEASPANKHNPTHPLLKFKTPIRHVTVTTIAEGKTGEPLPAFGDRARPDPSATSSRATETGSSPALLSNVQTVVDVKPSEPAVPVKAEQEKEKELEPKKEESEEKPVPALPVSADDLDAAYVRDSVADGTVFGPDHLFEQTWTLRNTGKVAWPAGCCVKFLSGDLMNHLDPNHPATTRDIQASCESTICYAPVLPGEEFQFTVLLRTPRSSGRFVSYWRLTTKDGLRFGHRLWCDIVVEKRQMVLPPRPVVAEPSRQAEKKEDIKAEPEAAPQHGQMIFPKLEKESPAASVHQESKAESVSAQEEDEYEDCEDEEWDEGDYEEDVLTDEEYDVLDASDEEFLDRRAKQN